MKSENSKLPHTKFAFLQSGPGVGPVTNNNFRMGKVLISRGHSVVLVGTKVADAVFDLAPHDLDVVSLNVETTHAALFPLVAYLNRSQPDVLIASGPPMQIIAAFASRLSLKRPCVVLRSHTQTSLYLRDRSPLRRRLLIALMRQAHSMADYDVATSRGSAKDLAVVLQVKEEEVGVLYNSPIDDDVIKRSGEVPGHPWLYNPDFSVIVASARLEPEKDFRTLIRAVALVNQEKDVKLIILGEGSLLKELKELCCRLGVEKNVSFVGHVANPYKYMAKADLFVFSSHFEGFANVVAEALACGCPVVSTDTPSGPAEILDSGRYGKLVPVGEAQAMARGILETLDNFCNQDALRKRASRFRAEKIVDDLLGLLRIREHKM